MEGTGKVQDEQAMREMMALLGEWKAPEPSAWFDARMMARFRAEQQGSPAGFWERLRDKFLFRSGVGARPLMAGSLALVLLAGGGSYIGLVHPPAAPVSATVKDLQLLDNNEQAIQQMDQLLDTSDDGQDQS